jgi:hypothetical protein
MEWKEPRGHEGLGALDFSPRGEEDLAVSLVKRDEEILKESFSPE